MIFTVQHQTDYSYEIPVSLSIQRFLLYPRLSPDIVLQHYELMVDPAGEGQWLRDEEDNHFYQVFYPEKMTHLRVVLSLSLQRHDGNPFNFLLSSEALEIPFALPGSTKDLLQPYLDTGLDLEDEQKLSAWAAERNFLLQGETVPLLGEWLQGFSRSIQYEMRHEVGIHPVVKTLASGQGSCRDIAVLAGAFMRQQGLPVRLVTGYLHTPQERTVLDEEVAGAELHAWIEVFLPGAGWRGLDPTNGVFCDHHYLPLAVGQTLTKTHPFQGNYFSDQPVSSRIHSEMTIHLEE